MGCPSHVSAWRDPRMLCQFDFVGNRLCASRLFFFCGNDPQYVFFLKEQKLRMHQDWIPFPEWKSSQSSIDHTNTKFSDLSHSGLLLKQMLSLPFRVSLFYFC
jgi:hypothetical protein